MTEIEICKESIKEYRKSYGQNQLSTDCIIQLMIEHRRKQLILNGVSRSLPSKKELSLKIDKELIEWDYNDLNSKTIFERGFKSCFYWFKNMPSENG